MVKAGGNQKDVAEMRVLDRKRSEATRAFTENTSGDHIRGGPASGARKEGRQRKSVGYRPKRGKR
jgi:hypothetical protein